MQTEWLKFFGDIPKSEVKEAAKAAWREEQRFREDMRKKGEETVKYIRKII